MSALPRVAPSGDRFLIGIVVGAVLLAVLGVAAVVLASRNPPAPADPSSPAGVVQAYAEALRAGDLDRAYGYLSRSAQAATSLADYRQRYGRAVRPSGSDQRLVIQTTRLEGDTAEVKVTVSRFYAGSGPFSSSTSHSDINVRLVREDGAWKIDNPVEPYPFWY